MTASSIILKILEHELEVAAHGARLAGCPEATRHQCAILARILGGAFEGDHTATPERAADAAFKLVTLLRELPRVS